MGRARICTLFFVFFTVYIVHLPQSSVHCSVYTAHSVHCGVYALSYFAHLGHCVVLLCIMYG